MRRRTNGCRLMPAMTVVVIAWFLSMAAVAFGAAPSLHRVPGPALIDRRRVTTPVFVAIVTVTCGVVVSPAIAVAAAGAGVALRRRRIRAQRRERTRAVADELPIAVSLFAIALQSGRSIASASEAIGPLLSGPVGGALVEFGRRQLAHVDTDRCLELLDADLAPAGAEFVEVLRASVRDGAAVAPALSALADEQRMRRRRALEAALRRLPVLLLLPLVVCVLPAFMLLTVVPPVVEAVSDLVP